LKLSKRIFELPLRHTFTISRGSTRVSRTLVVELEHEGAKGFGEAGENDFYGASIERMVEALERVRPLVESTRLDDPATLWEACRPLFDEDTFAQCALDIAAHDLWGKLRGQPVWKLWGLALDRLPPTDYTIGIDTIDVMIAKLHEFDGWPFYKIKLGTPNDVEIVRRLRQETDAVFRVDANCAWGVEETIDNAAALKELGVEFIEQPLLPENIDGMREVFARSVLPIIADESCRRETDVRECLGLFHGINVKLVKCGGLTPARRMLLEARRMGLKTMIGCMTESTVGISALAQLLPLADYADMDGALLLARDIASGVSFDRGRAIFPDENGCGVRLLAE
jgi:L-alanine-DL-glutamate epimerase-like enolase superfamily enzyme